MTFQGTGVALVTPFKQDQSIDFAALGSIIDHVINGGVDFLVALGTTAETPTLTANEKLQVLDFVKKHNNNRVPLVVGIGGNNTASVIQTIKDYPLEGVDGILSVVPYYNKPNQEGIYQHFKAIASATDKAIILYNVPGRTVANMLPATTLRLANEFKNIKAIKEASGNIAQCMEIIQDAPAHFSVLSGDDNLILPQAAIGMQGVISVIANTYPKEFTTLVNASLQNDMATARTWNYKLLGIIDNLFAEGNPAGVKYYLHLQGLCENVLRLPLVPVSKQLEEKIKNSLL